MLLDGDSFGKGIKSQEVLERSESSEGVTSAGSRFHAVIVFPLGGGALSCSWVLPTTEDLSLSLFF